MPVNPKRLRQEDYFKFKTMSEFQVSLSYRAKVTGERKTPGGVGGDESVINFSSASLGVSSRVASI